MGPLKIPNAADSRGRPLKIAVVCPTNWRSDDPSTFSIDLRPYIHAITALGHEPLLICRSDSIYNVDFPVVTIEQSCMECTEWWQEMHIDIALVLTWMGMPRIIKALKEAGVFVVGKGDTDGMFSPRLFPGLHWQIMLRGKKSVYDRLKSARHWLRRYTTLANEADQASISSISLADFTIVETNSAKQYTQKFLDYYGHNDLGCKIIVMPHVVPDDILHAPISTTKINKIVAIGRWNAPQKDAELLAATISMFLKKYSETEFVLIGKGGEKPFARLIAHHSQVRYIGAVSRTEIQQHFSSARICLLTSRWESFHVAAHEALCMGCTVVGPPVIPVNDICTAGSFGTLAQGRRPNQIVKAMMQELDAWNRQCHNPIKIAGFWRPYLSGMYVIRNIVDLFEEKQKKGSSTINTTRMNL